MPLRLPHRAPGARSRSLPSRRPRGAPTSAGAWHGLAGLALDALRARRLSLRLLICAALVLSLLGGGWLWLRHSSLVAVRHVHIAGVHGPQAIEIRDALDAAAQRMSTLDFSPAALRVAVAAYPEVASLSAGASFPHTLSIRVKERPPVATLVGPGERTAIAADGTVLGPALVSGSLPSIAAKTAPAPGAHVREAASLAATAVLGVAPGALLAYVTRAYEGPEGLTLQMRDGLLVYFGDATRPHAKWLSLARVLSSPNASGATYVDVRLPTRPAAGFTQPGSSSASASALAPAQVGSSDPASAQLAQRLSEEVGGVSSTSSGASETEPSSTGESTQSRTTESEASTPTPGG
ncbi:MAG TPA: FtsQ-type POTRA domain-containing protein [Solirubrobacteraceae bacterium]|jgi:cell division protein FtsQ|nr:FtsQ-type POTRA domain-containing protein [Solirubrobacteraceae bacterium]